MPPPRNRIRRALGGLGLAAALLGPSACRSTFGAGPPPGAHENLNAVLWLQTAAEYRAATLQAYRSALAYLDRGLADPTWTAAPEQTGDFGALPPAVILDMDEAIVRSDRFQAWLVKSDRPFRVKDWNDWVRTGSAEAIPGALEYVHQAVARHVKIFYVTNRSVEVKAASLANLRRLGFPIENAEDLLTQHERPGWDSDKSSRRALLGRTHRIVQIIGDNLNDFTSGARTSPEQRRALARRHAGFWGSRWILLPNPAYGGWEGALYGFDRDLSRDEILARKHRQLRPWR